MFAFFAVVITLTFLLPIAAHAEPKKKLYNNSASDVFKAALRTARERHVVTYVDEKTLMFTFETGRSLTSEGFVANASIEPEAENKATLILNVQSKKGFSWGAGDRMADKFYQQVGDELAGESKQKSAVKAPEGTVVVPEAKAVPAEPSMTKSSVDTAAAPVTDKGKISMTSTPDGADVYVDDAFVGNTPAILNLISGKHTVKVTQKGYQDWSREVSVFAGSEVGLRATLEKN
jgi:hypothetical protein